MLSRDGKGFQNESDEVRYCRMTLHALGIVVLQCLQNVVICCNIEHHIANLNSWLSPKFPFIGLCFRNETCIITTLMRHKLCYGMNIFDYLLLNFVIVAQMLLK